jgi:hypothetical protein
MTYGPMIEPDDGAQDFAPDKVLARTLGPGAEQMEAARREGYERERADKVWAMLEELNLVDAKGGCEYERRIGGLREWLRGGDAIQ